MKKEHYGDGSARILQTGKKSKVNMEQTVQFPAWQEWITKRLAAMSCHKRRITFLENYFGVPLKCPDSEKSQGD